MKTKINAFDYASEICKALPKGILLTTKAGEQVNTMTIGWGHIGIEWGKPIFVAYVRESRHTKAMLEENGEFTVNVPLGEYDPKILGYCGTKSGRDTDKIADMNLTLVEGESVSVPGIKEFPLTLECRLKKFTEEGVVGEIINVSADERVLDENGDIDVAKLQAIVYDPANHGYHVMGEKVGTAFSDGKKLIKE